MYLTELIENVDLDVEELTYEETDEPAVEYGSCYHCDTEPVPMLNALYTENFGSPSGIAVCLRCGRTQ